MFLFSFTTDIFLKSRTFTFIKHEWLQGSYSIFLSICLLYKYHKFLCAQLRENIIMTLSKIAHSTSSWFYYRYYMINISTMYPTAHCWYIDPTADIFNPLLILLLKQSFRSSWAYKFSRTAVPNTKISGVVGEKPETRVRNLKNKRINIWARSNVRLPYLRWFSTRAWSKYRMAKSLLIIGEAKFENCWTGRYGTVYSLSSELDKPNKYENRWIKLSQPISEIKLYNSPS